MSGGKSYLLRWGALAYALYLFSTTGIYDIPIGIFCEDYPTLKDRQVSRIEREFPKWLGTLKDSHIDGLLFQIAKEYGGGKLLLRNLDDPTKYMSTEFAGEFVDELTRNVEKTFTDLRNRLRYPGVDEVKFMGATNPGGVGHGWVKKYFVDHNSDDREQDRFFYIHANAYDNHYISPEYIKQLEALPDQQRKAYLEGSWDSFAGQYFPEIGKKHLIPSFLPKDSLIVGGMDWGRANPFSFHLATVDKIYYRDTKNEVITFYRAKTFFEVYGTEKDPGEWSRLIKENLAERFLLTLDNISWVRVDPMIFGKGADNSISIADQFKQDDPRWNAILKPANNDRIPGWTNMHRWLGIAPDGLPYWQWTNNCEALNRTLPQLIHDENIVEDVESSRKGGRDDDCGDDQRYMLKHLKFLDGFTGQIRNKRDQEPQSGNKAKFFTAYENMNQHQVDLDKFIPKRSSLL